MTTVKDEEAYFLHFSLPKFGMPEVVHRWPLTGEMTQLCLEALAEDSSSPMFFLMETS